MIDVALAFHRRCGKLGSFQRSLALETDHVNVALTKLGTSEL